LRIADCGFGIWDLGLWISGPEVQVSEVQGSGNIGSEVQGSGNIGSEVQGSTFRVLQFAF